MIEHEIGGALESRPWPWRAAAFVVAGAALLLAVDAAPLLYPEGVPEAVKEPVRQFVDRTPTIAGTVPVPLLFACFAIGLISLFLVAERFLLGLSRVFMWAPAFIVGIIFYEVVARYVFFAPTLWVNEMSLWVAGGVYMTAGLYALQQRSHIRIFILYDLAPRWVRKLFDIVSFICVAIFAFAVIWGGFGEALAKFLRWETFGTAFDPPIPATNKPLILLTMALVAFASLSNLIFDWNRAPESHEPEPELTDAEIAALRGDEPPSASR